MPSDVRAVFAGYPEAARARLLEVRGLLFDLAGEIGAGPLAETLKWGEPAYLTQATRAGSTVRLGLSGGDPAVFFICHTGLVDGFRADFPEVFSYLGNRGLVLGEGYDRDVLAICLTRALSYHRKKRRVRA